MPDQALSGEPEQQVRLIRACSRLDARVRSDCYDWLGRTLAVVTNGRFRSRGCVQLRAAARHDCIEGAGRMDDALVTFS